jgi:endonuclease-8
VPEGDTINRAAAALRTALVGRPTLSFEASRLIGPHPSAGRVIEAVTSHGKHLEIQWDDELVLHTHMRMTGSWHLYHEGERWRRPPRQARVVITVPEWVAVCFNSPVVETYRAMDRTRHACTGGLGPDLCDPHADLAECVRRMANHPAAETTVAELLLDQRVMAGVGNVYRSEVLWALEMSPFARIADLSPRDMVQLVNVSARMLRSNLHHAQRVTTTQSPSGLAVYGRGFKPCTRCGGTVSLRRVGEHARVLYWCPDCQVHLAPEARVPEHVETDDRPADPHPAAVKYLTEAREARARDDSGGLRRGWAVGFGTHH